MALTVGSRRATFRYYLSDYQFTDATIDTKQKMTELAETICSALGKPITEKKSEKKLIVKEKPEPVAYSTPQTTSQTKSSKTIAIGIVAAATVVALILGIVFYGKYKKTVDVTEPAGVAVQESESPVAENTETESESTEITSEDSKGVPEQTASTHNNSTNTFGVWELIAYEDRGAVTQINTDDLFILEDGTPYFSLEDGLSGSSESALASYLSMEDVGKYDLTAESSFEDTFDGSISKKTDSSLNVTFVKHPYIIDYNAPEENPTGLTYDDCYPDQFYFVHLTGSFLESPVKKSDVDTGIIYKKKYSLFSEQIFPALVGTWKDSMGNLWEFSVEDDKLTFKMTDVDGNTYNGVSYTHLGADREKVNFFERLMFEFDKYQTDYYALLSFDGQKLEMLDWNWNSFVLTKEQ